jgi:glycerol uptake facilitator protein
VITLGWGMAVAVAVYCVVQFSGAYINPAVALGAAVTGGLEWALVPGYIIAEFLGAFVGAVIVWLAYLPHWEETADPGLKLGVFCTAPAIYNTPANLITEVVGTFVLVFGVFGILANDLATGLFPLLVGLLVLGIGLSLGGPTGYAINPARDLGPRIAHAVLPIAGKGGNDWGYSWIPVVGPIIGGILGALAFTVLFG